MATGRTVTQKVGDWSLAYETVRDTLTPEALRILTQMTEGADPASINLGIAAARIVFANDRAAATVAALITQTGIKPVSLEDGE